ncbi:uncharacterized protein C13orf42 [Gouania willdenowi]|uniref:uncharacterized protein C13orf42 n=1 Tax=Gouania willdenowi TaxID=441366 RepID=UPI001054865F|nr:uncharacterized protein C13orf42 homolog [Gouania willdenowi]
MFRKINNVFRPNNHHGHRGRDAGHVDFDYHNDCTVRLVRSTSMLVVGQRTQTGPAGSTLKRSRSTVSVESTLYYYQRQEDQIWLYSQNQNCLEYLQALVALRRQYTKSVSDLKTKDGKATASKKKTAPPPPKKDKPISRAKPTAPPVPNEEDTLQFFDAVIASCDNEPQPKPYLDDGNADVDFIGLQPLTASLPTVASSSAQHDLHSNWVLRVPRAAEESEHMAGGGGASVKGKKKQCSSISSRLRIQRNPIHLPKVVESALQTLRFKPKVKKQ